MFSINATRRFSLAALPPQRSLSLFGVAQVLPSSGSESSKNYAAPSETEFSRGFRVTVLGAGETPSQILSLRRRQPTDQINSYGGGYTLC